MNRILKSLQKPLVTLFLLCLFFVPYGSTGSERCKGNSE